MKKLLYLILFIFLVSCEDSLNPFGELQEGYNVHFILNGTKKIQKATISKNFMVDNYDPYSVKENIYENDAIYFNVVYGDSIKEFQVNQDSVKLGKYNFKPYYFYNNNFEIKPNTTYNFEAVLPGGIKIKSKTTTPGEFRVLHEESAFTDTIIPSDIRNTVKIFWKFPGETRYYSLAKAYLIYIDNSISSEVRKYEIPYDYNGNTPILPVASYGTAFGIKNKVFEKALRILADKVKSPSKIEVFSVEFKIRIYDENLTSLLATSIDAGKGYTITLDEGTYSNIEGAKGIFGSFLDYRVVIKLNKKFIESFGFKSGLKG